MLPGKRIKKDPNKKYILKESELDWMLSDALDPRRNNHPDAMPGIRSKYKQLKEWHKNDKPHPVKEIVICAAIKYKDGSIIRGHRHGDCAYDCHLPLKKDFKGHVQGFITSTNRFVTREEGRKLQDAAGIKSVDRYRADTLFSEDLY